MQKPNIRVFYEAETGRVIGSKQNSQAGNERVTLRAGDVLAWLADAADKDRSWLNDFADDEITVSLDLYEVIQAYRHFRRSA